MKSDNMKDIKDYLHLYLGCQCTIVNGDLQQVRFALNAYNLNYYRQWYSELKPILRPLSDMTEDEFKEYSEPKVFASYGGVWYACDREFDPDFDGELIEFINEACDDDPENVIMCNIKSKHISYGWIEYEERYHGFGVTEEANWIKFLLSKSFDLFGLIEAGLAIDKTKQ